MNDINTALLGKITPPDISAMKRPLLAEVQRASVRFVDALSLLKVAALNLRSISVAMSTPSPVPHPLREETSFIPTPQTIQYMLEQTGLDDVGLLESMLPKVVLAKRVAPHRYEIQIAPIVDRIKWRMRMAARFGMSMEVFRDERIDENGKADDLAMLQAMLSLRAASNSMEGATKEDVAAIHAGQSSVIEKIDAIGNDVAAGIEETRRVGAMVTALIPPRPADCQCSERQLAEILDKLMAGRSERQIRRWEEYLASGGKSGSKPPMGYTLQTRLTIASATAWARSFADHERGKLSAKTFFDERTVCRRT